MTTAALSGHHNRQHHHHHPLPQPPPPSVVAIATGGGVFMGQYPSSTSLTTCSCVLPCALTHQPPLPHPTSTDSHSTVKVQQVSVTLKGCLLCWCWAARMSGTWQPPPSHPNPCRHDTVTSRVPLWHWLLSWLTFCSKTVQSGSLN